MTGVSDKPKILQAEHMHHRHSLHWVKRRYRLGGPVSTDITVGNCRTDPMQTPPTPGPCEDSRCRFCAVVRTLENLHENLREVTGEIKYRRVIAGWSSLLYRALAYQLSAARSWHRETLKQCKGASLYQAWKVLVLEEHRKEALEQIIPEEFKLGTLDPCRATAYDTTAWSWRSGGHHRR